MTAPNSVMFYVPRENFRKRPSKKTAGEYLFAAMVCMGDDLISIATFAEAIGETSYWLRYGRQFT